MVAVADVGRNLAGEPARRELSVTPPRGPEGAAKTAAFPPDHPGAVDVALVLDGGVGGASSGGGGAPAAGSEKWHKPVAETFMTAAQKARHRQGEAGWSVRERLSARSGALHLARAGRRAGKAFGTPGEFSVDDSDGEFVLPRDGGGGKKKKKKKKKSKEEERLLVFFRFD